LGALSYHVPPHRTLSISKGISDKTLHVTACRCKHSRRHSGAPRSIEPPLKALSPLRVRSSTQLDEWRPLRRVSEDLEYEGTNQVLRMDVVKDSISRGVTFGVALLVLLTSPEVTIAETLNRNGQYTMPSSRYLSGDENRYVCLSSLHM